MIPEPAKQSPLLDNLFAAARREAPALPLDDVRRLVGAAPPPASAPRWEQILRPFKPLPAMTSPLIAVATALYFAVHAPLPAGPVASLFQPSAPTATAAGQPDSSYSGGAGRPAFRPLPSNPAQWLAVSGYRVDPLTQKLCLASPPTAHDTTRQRRPQRVAAVAADSSFTGLPGTTAGTPGAPNLTSLNKLLGLEGLGGVMCVAGKKGEVPGTVSADLSREVLAQLGLRVDGDTVYYEHNVQDRGWLSITYQRAPVHCSKEVRLGPYNAQGGRPMTLYPWFVTTPDGRHAATYQLTNDQPRHDQAAYFAQVVERLAPISVRTAPDNVVVFWYEITPELLRVMPSATAHDLRCSYQPWLTPETRAAGLTPCQPEKVVQAKLPEAEMSIYPNPAHGEFHLALKLDREMKLKVRLFDMAGREVRSLSRADLTVLGNARFTFSLEGVDPGIYLVQLDEASGGGRWSRRLVVE